MSVLSQVTEALLFFMAILMVAGTDYLLIGGLEQGSIGGHLLPL